MSWLLSYLHKKISTHASLSLSQALIENLRLSSQGRWRTWTLIQSAAVGLNSIVFMTLMSSVHSRKNPVTSEDELKLGKELPKVWSQAWMHLDFPVCMCKTKLHFPWLFSGLCVDVCNVKFLQIKSVLLAGNSQVSHTCQRKRRMFTIVWSATEVALLCFCVSYIRRWVFSKEW